MSTEPEIVNGEVVPDYLPVPYSPGEIVSPRDLTDEQLAEVINEAKDFKMIGLALFERGMKNEALRRMDERAARGERGAWTIHVEGYKLEGDSPNQTEYDVDRLKAALEALVNQGMLGQEAINRVIVPSGWKVAKRALSQLVKLPGVKEVVDTCEVPSTRPRNVRVTRHG